jgi:hypothetical protein
MGYVYKVSERRYRQLLRTIAAGQDIDWDTVGRPLADHYDNLTDVSAEEAREMLKDLKGGA